MFKIILASLFGNVLSQGMMVGGTLDSHNCMIGAGYTWCKSSNNCVRQWETPCSDNFLSCDDCLMKQRSGMNIACPLDCNHIAIDPMPPQPVPTEPMLTGPVPSLPPQPVCPDVMCMIYCQYGHQTDSNGCQMCQCNDELPPPVTGTDCILQQPPCDNYLYVCPKLTEITNCNEGGIDGHTTFQLSLVIKDTVRNIYALYGDINEPLYLPPAYQSLNKLNNNIGGINPLLLRINPLSEYDSWLTIGVTDGDNDNLISSIGIDFNSWSDNSGISVQNGAVFVLNPELNIVEGNEYIIGQITVQTQSDFVAIFNAQGKTIDPSNQKTWTETNIHFPLIPPQNINHEQVPNNCISWYDGCNTCTVSNGNIGGCTRMMCFREDTPRCLEYNTVGH